MHSLQLRWMSTSNVAVKDCIAHLINITFTIRAFWHDAHGFTGFNSARTLIGIVYWSCVKRHLTVSIVIYIKVYPDITGRSIE